MLRVLGISGQEVLTLPVGEATDVRALKRQLHMLHGIPNRFRQKLLYCGNCLDDDAKLDMPMDLQLVLLTYNTAAEIQMEGMCRAAAEGAVVQMESMLQEPLEPNLASEDAEQPLLLAAEHGHVEVVRLLLEAGADSNFTTGGHRSALMCAAGQGHIAVMCELLGCC